MPCKTSGASSYDSLCSVYTVWQTKVPPLVFCQFLRNYVKFKQQVTDSNKCDTSQIMHVEIRQINAVTLVIHTEITISIFHEQIDKLQQ